MSKACSNIRLALRRYPATASCACSSARPVPLDDGFRRIEKIIGAANRPLTAFCACELRSPAAFSESGFAAFNKVYVGTLERWKIFDGKTNPVARSNVCPAIDPPPKPSFHAFCYTETASGTEASFVIAGSGEAPEAAATIAIISCGSGT